MERIKGVSIAINYLLEETQLWHDEEGTQI